MKKVYGFFGAAALLALASCSSENVDSPDVPNGGSDGGDFYVTMNISQSSTVGSRTSTPNQGKENAKDVENKITDGLLIVAEGSATAGYTYVTKAAINTSNGDLTGKDNKYSASFKMAREELEASIGQNESKTFALFMIANPTTGMADNYTTGQPIQQLFSLESDAATYWTDNKFLMTSSKVTDVTIPKAEVAKGKHTTQADALHLGDIEIQRVMSRIDLNVEQANTVFSAENSNSTLKDITVTFDGVALVNMAKSAYMFKVVADNNTGISNSSIKFADETATNYVFSPSWTGDYLLPLFTGLNMGLEKPAGTHVGHKTLIYTTIETIKGQDEDDANYTQPSQGPTGSDPYHIWRYCMENTNYDKDNQKNGNTTGVVFRAQITGTNIDEKTGDLYAYNNVIIGNKSDLDTYVANEEPEEGDENFEMIKHKYGIAKDAAGESDTDNALFNASLVSQGFTIYSPEGGKYYCYYTYWNRHNDNNDNSVMGPTEFATVRNNVYKLKVSKITKLGHPGEPGNDPDPEDPGTPDESTDFWGEITCTILPWEVRVNDIEF